MKTNIILFCFSGDYTEAIELQYDPSTVSYLELLKMFWDHHDPTAKFKKQVCYSPFTFLMKFKYFLSFIY